MKMKIKIGDSVRMLVGKDSGKSGKITQVFPATRRVVVDGLNQHTKQIRARQRSEKGQKITFWAPVDASNVALLCPKCGRATRVGVKELEGGQRVRRCKKCQEVI